MGMEKIEAMPEPLNKDHIGVEDNKNQLTDQIYSNLKNLLQEQQQPIKVQSLDSIEKAQKILNTVIFILLQVVAIMFLLTIIVLLIAIPLWFIVHAH